jgi:hypothetical protein
MAALDEEDIAERNKKDKAIATCKANAEEKKLQEALLEVGQVRIAVFKNNLSICQEQNKKNALRPPYGPVQKKALRPSASAPLVTPVCQHGANCALPELELDSSRVNDKDFEPQDNSNGESEEDEAMVIIPISHLDVNTDREFLAS